jgi:hypothetical protein
LPTCHARFAGANSLKLSKHAFAFLACPTCAAI